MLTIEGETLSVFSTAMEDGCLYSVFSIAIEGGSMYSVYSIAGQGACVQETRSGRFIACVR